MSVLSYWVQNQELNRNTTRNSRLKLDQSPVCIMMRTMRMLLTELVTLTGVIPVSFQQVSQT